jgi:Ca-activated chloride channel family protein
VDIKFPEPNQAILELVNAEGRSDDRDFILRYSLAETEPEVGVLVTRSDDGGYFLINLEPPAREPSGVYVPREYLFLLDVYGSMGGFPLDISKKIMCELIGDLGSGDLFNIIAFSGGDAVFSESGSARADGTSKQKAMKWIRNLSGSGGTNLLSALKKVLKLPRAEGTSRTVVVLTDGYVSVEKEAFQLIRNTLGEANLFAIGIGTSVNRHLIEGMARAGGGEEFVATNPKQGQVIASQFIALVSNPVLTDISINFEGLEVEELLPAKQPDLFMEKPVRVIGRFSGDWEGSLTLEGKAGTKPFRKIVDLSNASTSEAESIGILWAREKVRQLMDDLLFGDEERIRGQVVALGLEFRLLTKYTSFVAVEEVIARTEGDLETVMQPSPLPAGVSVAAIGAGVPASPEPGTIGLIVLVGAGLLLLFFGKKRKDRQ